MKTLEALIATLKDAKNELSKAIKPGPTLDYSKMNPGSDKAARAAAEAAAPTINYNNDRMSTPKYTGAADRTAAVRAKLDAEGKETALDTMKRRGQISKEENKSYAPQPNTSENMAMSEDEPHKDDPRHEQKEQAKAKKIKEEAEDILDMHKGCGEMIKAQSNGQWYLDDLEKDNSVKPFGANIYNEKANIGRKATRTGEVVEGVGRNNAVRNYTTSGSSMQAANEANQAKEQKAKTAASTRTMKDMSPEELKAIQDKQGKK